MSRFFYSFYLFIQKNKIVTTIVALLFLGICGYFGSKISFEENISNILPKNEKTDLLSKVFSQQNFADKIIVVFHTLEKGETEVTRELALQFADSLQAVSPYIKKVEGIVETQAFLGLFEKTRENLPLFLSEKDYEAIASKLHKDSIDAQVKGNLRALTSPAGMFSKEMIVNDPLGMVRLALRHFQELNTEGDYHIHDGLISTADNRSVMLFITPQQPEVNAPENHKLVDYLQNLQREFGADYLENTAIYLYGTPVVAIANELQIKSDLAKTITISLVILMLVLIVYYRNILIPLIIFLPAVFGGAFALMCIYFLKETVSAISLSVSAVLIGITLDYSLHILTHIKHNQHAETLFKDISKPIIISSTTTAAAFLCLLFVNSQVLSDLGIFAGICILATAFFALLLIPVLYVPKNYIPAKEIFIDKIASIDYDRKKILLGCIFIFFVAGLFTLDQTRFNGDIDTLNYLPEEALLARDILENQEENTKSFYVVSYGENQEEVFQTNSRLYASIQEKKEDFGITHIQSVGNIILSEKEQQARINRWNSFWKTNRDFIIQTLISSGEAVGFKPETHARFYELSDKNFVPVAPKEYLPEEFSFIEDFFSESEDFYTISTVIKSDIDTSNELQAYIKSLDNVLLIDRKQINEQFLEQLKIDFSTLINYSTLAIVLLLFLFLRRFELVLFNLISLAVAGVLFLVLMYLLGLSFNIFSFIVCSLIFGLAIDFSVLLTSGLQKEHTYGKNELYTYKASIVLAVLTTIFAIGSLVFAKHPALYSVSLISLIGILTAMMVNFTLVPFLYKKFILNRTQKGLSPITFRMMLHSFFSFVYYGLGGIILAGFGKIYLYFFPGKTEKKLLTFRKIVSLMLKSVLYSNPFVKKKIINTEGENFEKPAMIIANHTSILDSIAIGMLYPKQIFLVNDWVYKSPFIGGVAKLAGFYPASQGLEGSVDFLKQKIDAGYSLMIFPEGTRSPDNDIRRFHKGAFYLSERLHLDILPVYLHGLSETVPRDDFFIYNGKITVTIGSRIPQSDMETASYSVKTKKINSLFRKNFAQIRKEEENENYFRNKLYLSYLYKEDRIVRAVKNDFEKNKILYHQLNTIIDDNAVIFHIADDWGQIDFLLTMQQVKRTVVSFVSDVEKRSVAANGYVAKKRKITYLDSPVAPSNAEVLLISDKIFISHIQNTDFKQFKKIILLDVNTDIQHFEKHGFLCVPAESRIRILEKTLG